MKLTGNISQIKQNRENKNQEVELHLDSVEYITHKKDGKYFQAYDLVEELDTPLVITGDRLALIHAKPSPDGVLEYKVFDKVGEAYELNENKQLSITVAHDFDADTTVLSSASYVVTVPIEEFNQIKSEQNKARKQKQGKGRRGK